MEAVREQSERFASLPEVRSLLNAVPNIVMILNGHRQVVYSNRSIMDLLGIESVADVYGQRPGELLDCEHACETRGGCGTSDACSVCGAARAMASAERGVASVRECRIIQKGTGRGLDLRVSATPMPMNGSVFTVLAVDDISHEKRRQALERIFFHDLLNTAGGVMGYAELLKRASAGEVGQIADSIMRLAGTLVEEIRAQRDLTAAENRELVVRMAPVSTRQMLSATEQVYRNHEVAYDQSMRVDPEAADVTFRSDERLLLRVLSNMVKNAFEASPKGGTVSMGCRATLSEVEFWVHNEGVMSREVQLQVFQRSFSTKGTGRGLGTYSIKLLSERYLNGRVTFTSTAEEGTTFRVTFAR